MERVVISRLNLSDKRTVGIGDAWPSEVLVPDELGRAKKVPTPAVVGAIFFVQTETKSESWVEDEDDTEKPNSKRMVTVTESYQTPEHFEVWAFPTDDSILNATGETRCLRFQREEVIDVEEIWPLDAAKELVKIRRKATELSAEEPEGEDDDADQQLPPNGASASP